jgi:hypothetical protein
MQRLTHRPIGAPPRRGREPAARRPVRLRSVSGDTAMGVDRIHEEQADEEGQERNDAHEQWTLPREPIKGLTQPLGPEEWGEESGDDNQHADHPKRAGHA